MSMILSVVYSGLQAMVGVPGYPQIMAGQSGPAA